MTTATATTTMQRRPRIILVERREAILPDTAIVLRRNATAAVPDPDSHTRRALIEGLDIRRGGLPHRHALLALEHLVCLARTVRVALVLVRDDRLLTVVGVGLLRRLGARRRGRLGQRGDGDLDGLALHAALDGRAEGVLEQLRDDVLEVHRDVGECVFRLAGDGDARAHAVLELADLGDHGLAVAHDVGRAQLRVDDADEAGLVGGVRARVAMRFVLGAQLVVRLRAHVQGDVLLGDQARADAGAQVLVQEARHLLRADVAAGLEESPSQDADGVGVRVHQVGHDLGEADLVLQRLDALLRPRQQRRQRV